MPKIVELIYSEISRGEGTEEDVCRMVQQWHEKDGTLMFEKDPIDEIYRKKMERREYNLMGD